MANLKIIGKITFLKNGYAKMAFWTINPYFQLYYPQHIQTLKEKYMVKDNIKCFKNESFLNLTILEIKSIFDSLTRITNKT